MITLDQIETELREATLDFIVDLRHKRVNEQKFTIIMSNLQKIEDYFLEYDNINKNIVGLIIYLQSHIYTQLSYAKNEENFNEIFQKLGIYQNKLRDIFYGEML